MFYIFKKTEGLYLIRFIRYIEYNNQIFPVTLYKSMTLRGIIPRWVNKKFAKTWLTGVSYPGESLNQIFHKISPGWHTPVSQYPRIAYLSESVSPGYHTALSQSPQGMQPQGVNSNFLTLLHRH